MKLGFVSDSVGGMSFDEMLDHAVRMGVSGVEVNTCGWSTAPHFDRPRMLDHAAARKAFQKAFPDRGLEVISLNANGDPLHPTDPAQGEGLKDTIRVAGELGIRTVCTMSGLPAGNATDTMPNWVVSSWPPETQEILYYQWEEKNGRRNLSRSGPRSRRSPTSTASSGSRSNCTATNVSTTCRRC